MHEPHGSVNSDRGSLPLGAVRVRRNVIQADADSRDELFLVHSGGIPAERMFGCAISCLSPVYQLDMYAGLCTCDHFLRSLP